MNYFDYMSDFLIYGNCRNILINRDKDFIILDVKLYIYDKLKRGKGKESL